jgi:hypothetical protein
MNGSNAERDLAPESGITAGFGAPAPSSRRRARSTADTLAVADPFADTAPESFRPDRPDWCVDAGAELLTMSTFELWAAIERAEVTPSMRVWREGMECWTALDRLPEFALAIANTPLPPPEPPPEPAAGPTSAPMPEPEAAPESSPRASISPAPGKRRGARWVALGSAVAAAAVAAALLAVSPKALRPAPSVAAAPAVVAALPSPQPEEPTVIDAVDRPPAPEARTHEERGQRRLPRGGKRAYGR